MWKIILSGWGSVFFYWLGLLYFSLSPRLALTPPALTQNRGHCTPMEANFNQDLLAGLGSKPRGGAHQFHTESPCVWTRTHRLEPHIRTTFSSDYKKSDAHNARLNVLFRAVNHTPIPANKLRCRGSNRRRVPVPSNSRTRTSKVWLLTHACLGRLGLPLKYYPQVLPRSYYV